MTKRNDDDRSASVSAGAWECNNLHLHNHIGPPLYHEPDSQAVDRPHLQKLKRRNRNRFCQYFKVSDLNFVIPFFKRPDIVGLAWQHFEGVASELAKRSCARGWRQTKLNEFSIYKNINQYKRCKFILKLINLLSNLPPFIRSEWGGHVQKSEQLFDCSQKKLSNSASSATSHIFTPNAVDFVKCVDLGFQAQRWLHP